MALNFTEICFGLYLLALCAFMLVAGVNFARIGMALNANPRIITLLLPLLVNFVLANSLFYDIHPIFSTIVPCLLCYGMGKKLENVRVLGLAGGICAGRSTLVKMIHKNLKSMQVIDTEDMLSTMTLRSGAVYARLAGQMGESVKQILTYKSNQIALEKLNALDNTQLRSDIGSFIDKSVYWQVFKQVLANIVSKKKLMIVNIPPIYSRATTWKYRALCYPIVEVTAPPKIQKERMKGKCRVDEETASRLLSRDGGCRLGGADFTIDNSSEEEELLSKFLTKISPCLSKNFPPKAHAH